jgi:hypothetical protein
LSIFLQLCPSLLHDPSAKCTLQPREALLHDPAWCTYMGTPMQEAFGRAPPNHGPREASTLEHVMAVCAQTLL